MFHRDPQIHLHHRPALRPKQKLNQKDLTTVLPLRGLIFSGSWVMCCSCVVVTKEMISQKLMYCCDAFAVPPLFSRVQIDDYSVMPWFVVPEFLRFPLVMLPTEFETDRHECCCQDLLMLVPRDFFLWQPSKILLASKI